jgi:hypothetical protein
MSSTTVEENIIYAMLSVIRHAHSLSFLKNDGDVFFQSLRLAVSSQAPASVVRDRPFL